MLVLLVLNAFLFPRLMSAQVEEVGYNTFMEMMEKQQIAQVQIESNQIIFSDKNSPTGFYKTGPMEDPALVDRLYASGATFGTEIVNSSPSWSLLPSDLDPAHYRHGCHRPVCNAQDDERRRRHGFHDLRQKATPRFMSSRKPALNSMMSPERMKPRKCSPSWLTISMTLKIPGNRRVHA